MPKKDYDPLAWVPSPDTIRERLKKTLILAERLRILLEFAERIQAMGLDDISHDNEECNGKQ